MPVVTITKLPIDPAANKWFFYIAGDPSTAGLAATQGSLATRIDGTTEGRVYQKTSTNDTDWTLVGATTKRNDNGSQSAGFSVDFTAGLSQRVVLGASILLTLTNGAPGQVHCLEIVQDSNGSRSPTFSPALLGTSPTWSTVGSRRDIVALYFDGTNYSVIASAVNA